MQQLSKVLRQAEGNRLAFWCPGCDEPHAIRIRSTEPIVSPSWEFDGNIDTPTFSPSILVRSGHYADGNTAECWCNFAERFPDQASDDDPKCGICHSFVRAGRIEFLSDCTHELAGQTVDMVEFEE